MVEPDDKIKQFLYRFGKWILLSSGVLFLLFFILSFTDIPYHAYHWLGTSNSKLYQKPDVIVLLGGSGMPSPDGLLRSYFAAEAANKDATAKIIIALPYNEEDSARQLNMLAHELIIRGVDSTRIEYEGQGFNTHSQAENIAVKYGDKKSSLSVLLVTSPEHMFRAVKTFMKVGFNKVGGTATFEKPPDKEKIKDTQNTPDTRVKDLSLRYNMWSYMNCELLVVKEYCAISYYWMKGWI